MRKKGKGAFAATVIGLTALFCGAYFVLRALPSAQCGFLHYEEVVNADGEIEFCATNHAGFLDLTRLVYPVRMDLSVEGEPAVNETLDVVLELSTPGGTPIAPHELAVTHTEKMHLMLVDGAQRDYHHLHPVPEGASGRYRFQFRPAVAGTYRVFVEVVPVRTRRQVIATGRILVPGPAPEPAFAPADRAVVDNLRFHLRGGGSGVRTGADHLFGIDVRDSDGRAVPLETIMGAKGHMVAFDYAGRGFAHMHPVSSIDPESADDALDFLFNVPEPGRYRLWAQVQYGGREIFAPFDLTVVP